MGRLATLCAAALIAIAAILVGALAMRGGRPDQAALSTIPAPAAIDDLSAELRRCGTLGPSDAPDAHCQAIWEESRRRFFGEPAHTVAAPSTPATSPSSQNARETP